MQPPDKSGCCQTGEQETNHLQVDVDVDKMTNDKEGRMSMIMLICSILDQANPTLCQPSLKQESAYTTLITSQNK